MPAAWIALGVVLATTYFIVGVLLMLRMDSSARYYAMLDGLSVAQQMFCAVFWPLALPAIAWRMSHVR